MKRFLSILLAALMLLSLAACGTTPVEIPDASSDASDTTEALINDPYADLTYKHVVIVGIDGMGAYHKGADTPDR